MNGYMDTDWCLVDFGDEKKTGVEKSAPVSIRACPKCGRELGKGGHFHVKACEGKK